MILALLVVCLLSPALQADLDPNVGLTEKEFEDYFHVPPAEDPEEENNRAEALRQNQEYIREINKKYEEGEITWFDKVNEYSNLPDDEADAEMTGLSDDDPLEVDPESEMYFASLRSRRYEINLPESYNAVAEGLVSPVKNQAGSQKSELFIFRPFI